MLDRGRRQSRREQSFFQQCLEQDSAYFPRSQDSHSFVQEIKPHIFLRRDILHGCLALGPSASSARIHHVCLNGCSSGVNLFSDAPSRFSSELQRLPVFKFYGTGATFRESRASGARLRRLLSVEQKDYKRRPSGLKNFTLERL